MRICKSDIFVGQAVSVRGDEDNGRHAQEAEERSPVPDFL